jgi:hypothetical protein
MCFRPARSPDGKKLSVLSPEKRLARLELIPRRRSPDGGGCAGSARRVHPLYQSRRPGPIHRSAARRSAAFHACICLDRPGKHPGGRRVARGGDPAGHLGIDQFLVVLSTTSITAEWVLTEVELASERYHNDTSFRVLPLVTGRLGEYREREFINRFQQVSLPGHLRRTAHRGGPDRAETRSLPSGARQVGSGPGGGRCMTDR